MKKFAKYILFTFLLKSPISLIASCNLLECNNNIKTVFIPMTQGQNLYTQYHKPILIETDPGACSWRSNLSITYRFEQSRNNCQIAQNFFGSNILSFKGQNFNDGRSLIAEYFTMGPDTNTSISINPRIRNQIIDLQLDFGGENLWFQINIPIVYSNWQINSGCGAGGCAGSMNLQKQTTATIGLAGQGYTQNYSGATPNMLNETFSNMLQPVAINGKVNNQTASPVPVTIGSSVTSSTPQSVTINNISNLLEFPTAITISDDYVDIEFAPGSFGSIVLPTTNLNSDKTFKEGGSYDSTSGTYTSTYPLITDNTNYSITLNNIYSAPNVGIALGGYIPMSTSGTNTNAAAAVPCDLKTRLYNKFNFSQCGSASWGIADLPMQLGWDFCKNENYHFGLYFKFVIPTGTNLNQEWASFIFSPILGNGRHFEIGIGVTGHTDIYTCNENNLIANIDGYITHMIGSSSFRTFDATNQPLSRYALLKSFDTKNIYTGTISPLGDINNCCVNTSFAIRGEGIIDFTYNYKNWDSGMGYAFAGQSKESLECLSTWNGNKLNNTGPNYGYMGYSNMAALEIIGADSTNSSVTGWGAPIVLVGSGGNITSTDVTYTKNMGNITTPSPIPQLNDTLINGLTNAATPAVTLKPGGNKILTKTINECAKSNNGAFDAGENGINNYISIPDFENSSGLMNAQILNRIFAHINYKWTNSNWTPEIGILGSFGFGSNATKTAEYWDIGGFIGFSF
jgi:hypothetical protein